jgi:hypothetical protein
MFARIAENTSSTRQRVNESQSVHSLALLRACKGAKHGAVQLSSHHSLSDELRLHRLVIFRCGWIRQNLGVPGNSHEFRDS